MLNVFAIHDTFSIRGGKAEDAAVVLVVVVALKVLMLKPNPFLRHVSVPPHNVVKNVLRKTQYTSLSDSAVMICFKLSSVSKD